jgi:hypothetical protein
VVGVELYRCPHPTLKTRVRYAKGNSPIVSILKDGHLVPEVLQVIDLIAKHHEIVLETGHISAEEGLMVVREARRGGVQHIVKCKRTLATAPISNLCMRSARNEAR